MTVVGAGPYGLSVAAHLIGAGIETRVFGESMSFWRGHMPAGMKLRSAWKASSLSAPGGRYSLDEYVANGEKQRIQPVPIEDFIRYGEWFQRQAVPGLETRKISSVEHCGDRFRITLEDGETFDSRQVTVAAGLAKQAMYPAQFQGLSRHLVSHTADHVDLGCFRGMRVAVIGRGQSAIESAALLAEAGAVVEVICRGPVHWIGTETFGVKEREGAIRKLVAQMRAPSGVGPFPVDWFADSPRLGRLFPTGLRARLSKRCLRPAAAGWLMPRMDGVQICAGRTVTGAQEKSSGLELHFDDGERAMVQHVLLATGYTLDISKPGILAPSLVNQIRLHSGVRCPVLSASFESSVKGLRFAGSSAVPSHGPLMRFVAGAEYAARSIARGARKS